MSAHLFWNKYDRMTTCQSFFEIGYRDFTPELSSRDYENIIATKLCEDLLDDFLNTLKVVMIKNLELLETSYTSELCLCSHKRLRKFMENVLEYIKLERIYLSYLEYPLRSGVSSGENTLINSLLRFRCLLKDFKLIFAFNSKEEIEDFENAKDLVHHFSCYMKTAFAELKEYCLSLRAQGVNSYGNELRIILDVLAICDEIHESQLIRATKLISAREHDSEILKTEEIDEFSWLLGNNSSDAKAQLMTSIKVTSGQPAGLEYRRLEPEYLLKVKFDQNTLSRSLNKKLNSFNANPIGSEEEKNYESKSYDFHKYDKELKDNRQLNAKGKLIKEQPKEEVSVVTILNKGKSRIAQEIGIFNGLQEPQKKTLKSCVDTHNVKKYPLTRILEKGNDMDYSELLSLVNVEYDVNGGMKLSTNAAQQAKIKQRAAELEEQSEPVQDQRVRTEGAANSDKGANSSDSDSDLKSDESFYMDIREKRLMLERRRRNLNAETDGEFQQLYTGLHGEPTIINNYAFYENTLLKYEKPSPEYLKETEMVLERPTHAIDEMKEDYCFRDLTPRSGRRKFLANVFGKLYLMKMRLILIFPILLLNRPTT